MSVGVNPIVNKMSERGDLSDHPTKCRHLSCTSLDLDCIVIFRAMLHSTITTIHSAPEGSRTQSGRWQMEY